MKTWLIIGGLSALYIAAVVWAERYDRRRKRQIRYAGMLERVYERARARDAEVIELPHVETLRRFNNGRSGDAA